MTALLSTRDLVVGYEGRTVLDGLDLDLPADTFTVIVGPNACGKSTLLRTMARLLTPRRGAVLLDGAAIRDLPTRDVARRLGVLPQSPLVPEGITVADLVGRGRQPYQRWWRQWSAEDGRAVEEAMRLADVAGLADRAVDTLSGGQRQRVWIAMTLAQDTDALLLDEPTTYPRPGPPGGGAGPAAPAARRAGPDRGGRAARPQPGGPVRRPPDRHARRRGGRRRPAARDPHRGPGPGRVRAGLRGRALPGQRRAAGGARPHPERPRRRAATQTSAVPAATPATAGVPVGDA